MVLPNRRKTFISYCPVFKLWSLEHSSIYMYSTVNLNTESGSPIRVACLFVFIYHPVLVNYSGAHHPHSGKHWLSLSSFCGKKPVKFLLSALGCWLLLVLFRSKGSQVVEIDRGEPVVARRHNLTANFLVLCFLQSFCLLFYLGLWALGIGVMLWIYLSRPDTCWQSVVVWILISYTFCNDLLLLLQKKLLWWGVTFHFIVGVPVSVEDVVRNDSGLERWP